MKLEEILKNNNVVDSWENRPQAFTGQKVDTATFIGPNSASWDKGMYEEALRMEQEGFSPEDIWAKTMNGRRTGGQMMQEIDDSKAKLQSWAKLEDKVNRDDTSESGSLWEYLNHNEVNKAYPGIAFSKFDLSQSEKNDEGERASPFGSHIPGGRGGDGEGETGYAGMNTDAVNLILENIGSDEKITEDKHFDLDLTNQWLRDNGKAPNADALRMHKNMAIPNQTLFGGRHADGQFRSDKEILSTILHENQHSIQSLEDWGGGVGNDPWQEYLRNNRDVFDREQEGLLWNDADGNLTRTASDLDDEHRDILAYLYQPVEAEARLTQTRMNLNQDERRKYFPFNRQTEDNPYGYDVEPGVMKGLLEAYNNR